MADLYDKEKRSDIMSRIKGKNSAIELVVRQFLFSQGFRYRIHYKKLKGKPDIVFPSRKIIIEVHGCYWHSHRNCKLSYRPKTNSDFWKNKLESNIIRDVKKMEQWRKEGWRVITVWECELEGLKKNQTLTDLKNTLGELINANTGN
jgi:DNA mismatch endonuclease (patch repair protein)